jgi:hypothetical protein
MKKMICTLLLAGVLLGFSGVHAFAEDPPSIGPLWANTHSVVTSLSFSSNTANASGVIIGNSDTKSISAVFALKVKGSNGSYSTVYTWPGVQTSGTMLSFSGTTAATSGKTYRLYVTATVVNNAGVSETVTSYTEKTY